ncbi:MAG: aspartate 1-decarboxylase [Alphaproteobacteria bacterium]|nr:aspartate 1-decarboxylase [Alphaproteobacteria bacterium]
MILNMLKCKLHRATVTKADLDYEGSITIDRDLIDKTGLIIYEQVDVLNITNGNRLTTYVIEGKRGSGEICINGAAAHLVKKGDLVIICAYAQVDEKEAKSFEPTILLLDSQNNVKRKIGA